MITFEFNTELLDEIALSIGDDKDKQNSIFNKLNLHPLGPDTGVYKNEDINDSFIGMVTPIDEEYEEIMGDYHSEFYKITDGSRFFIVSVIVEVSMVEPYIAMFLGFFENVQEALDDLHKNTQWQI